MDAFYSNPPELLLLQSPPWELEHSIFLDRRFENTYSLAQKFDVPPNPISLFILKPDNKQFTKQLKLEEFISAKSRRQF